MKMKERGVRDGVASPGRRWAGVLRFASWFAVATLCAGSSPSWAAEKETKPWKIEAEAGVEYDSRVGNEALDATSGKADVAALLGLSGEYAVLDDPKQLSLDVGYDFSQSLHEDLTTFDLQSHTGKIVFSRKLDGVTLNLDYRYSRSFLDSNDFLGYSSVRPSALVRIDPQWYVQGTYEFADKNFVTDDDRDARQHGVGLDNFFFFNESRSYVLLGYLLELDRADGPQFDYLANTGKVELDSALDAIDPDLSVKLGYRFRFRNYDDVTPSIGSERLDRRHTAFLRWEYAVNEFANLDLQYEYTDTISNLSTVDFVRNDVTFNLALTY